MMHALYKGRRVIMAVLLVLIALNEIRRHYFRGAGAGLKAVPARPYLVLFPADAFLLGWIQHQSGRFHELLSRAGQKIGKNSWQALIVLYLAALIFRTRAGMQLVFGSVIANALTGLASTIFKFTILRARPDAGLGPFSFFNFSGMSEDKRMFQSFSSGDVAIVAGACGFLFFSIKNRFLRLILVLLPLVTAYSRVNLNRHWPSDTLLSVGLGFLIGNAVFRWRQQMPPAAPAANPV